MNYDQLFERILRRVDDDAYLAGTESVDPVHHAAIQEIESARRDPTIPKSSVQTLIHALHHQGRIDRVMLYSALHVLAASPPSADYEEAARLTASQEMAALNLGGPQLQGNLASVERHRGVLAFLGGHYDVALDYFSRAFERQHNAMNLSNVLSTLIRLGDVSEAADLLRQIRTSFPVRLTKELDHLIRTDTDLALLRVETQ